MPLEVNDRMRQRHKKIDEERRPSTGNRIVQEFTASGVGRTVIVKLYEQWTVHVEFVAGATGTVLIEATPDNLADLNIQQGPHAGDPEDNNWIDIASTTDTNARIREPDDTIIYQLARANLTNVVATGDQLIRVTYVARQFVK